MEIIIPITKISINNVKLIDAILMIKNSTLYLIGTDENGMYSEYVYTLHNDFSQKILMRIESKLKNVIDELNSLLKHTALIFGKEFDVMLSDDIIKVVNDHLRYLDRVASLWRAFLDSVRLGRLSLTLRADKLYVPYISHSLTLHYVKEPFSNALVEMNILTERKVSGNVRIKVGEDLIAKMEIRTLSAMYVLSQTDLGNMPNQIVETLIKVRDVLYQHVDRLKELLSNISVEG